MINWDIFKDNLQQYIDNNSAEDSLKFSVYLSDLYYNTIISGMDQYGNTILSVDKTPLGLSLYAIFSKSKQATPIDITFDLNQSFNLFWSTVILNMNGVIPTMLSPVSNNITKLGNGGIVILQNYKTSTYFVSNITNFCKMYTSLLTGMYTVLMPSPTGAVVTPLPWIGIK